MKRAASIKDAETLGEMAALKRAARSAWKLSVETGTPFWVMKGGKMVDLNARGKKRKRW
jgi:hypothetical protein